MQDVRKQQFKLQKQTMTANQIRMLIPFTNPDDYSPSQVKQSLGMMQGLMQKLNPDMKFNFAGLDIETPEYKKASKAWIKIAGQLDKGEINMQQAQEQFMGWAEHADLSRKRKLDAQKSFKERTDQIMATQKAEKEEQIRLDDLSLIHI